MASKELMVKAVEAAFTSQVSLIFAQECSRFLDKQQVSRFEAGFRNACDAYDRAINWIERAS